jgi:glycosyltransferase involved in cell wall biosynthesis
MPEKVLVFIPMYNCERQIPRVLDKFNESVRELVTEILIVDNGSTDNSLDACREAMDKLSGVKSILVQNESNYGLGGSHKVAFNYAIEKACDYVIVLHGDDQGDIRDVVPHLRQGRHRGVDCLLGARFMKGSRLVNYSWFRTLGNHVFNWIFSATCRHLLHDLGAGLNVYKTSFLKSYFYLKFPNALTFNYYMILYTVAVGASFRFFPLTWREEDQVSNVRLARQTLRMLEVLWMFTFARRRFMNEWHQPAQDYNFNVVHRRG